MQTGLQQLVHVGQGAFEAEVNHEGLHVGGNHDFTSQGYAVLPLFLHVPLGLLQRSRTVALSTDAFMQDTRDFPLGGNLGLFKDELGS